MNLRRVTLLELVLALAVVAWAAALIARLAGG